MRIETILLVGFMGLVCLAGCQRQSPQRLLRILPLGDSITQGGRTDRQEYTYRLPLQRLLLQSGVQYDFIGSLRVGLQPEAAWPEVAPGVPFDPDHEGHYGWKTAAVREQLSGWLQLYDPPDIVLIHLGTNDQNAADGIADRAERDGRFNEAVVEPLEDMIGLLRARNPRVLVLVGHLNFEGGAAAEIRPLVEAMVGRLTTTASPVVTVPHYQGFIAQPGPGSDTFDWAHPNPQGQEKMARAWFEAMQPYLRP